MNFDAGNAGELLRVVLEAIAANTTFPVILDKPRTVRVISTSYTATEARVMTKDEDSGEFVSFYIPRSHQERASATVANPLSA